jgi:hypothetical protein
MKRVLLGLVVLAVTVCLATVAGANQKNTGCGLGSMAFQGQDGLVFQVFAATTNGTFGNQTFGITSGTSNCEQYKSFTMNDKVNTFVADNMDSLAKDIAKGEGEYLDTMAGLMALAPTERPQFFAALQQNFSRIYSSPAVTPADVLAGIGDVASSM